jgi:hypothetical protein
LSFLRVCARAGSKCGSVALNSFRRTYTLKTALNSTPRQAHLRAVPLPPLLCTDDEPRALSGAAPPELRPPERERGSMLCAAAAASEVWLFSPSAGRSGEGLAIVPSAARALKLPEDLCGVGILVLVAPPADPGAAGTGLSRWGELSLLRLRRATCGGRAPPPLPASPLPPLYAGMPPHDAVGSLIRTGGGSTGTEGFSSGPCAAHPAPANTKANRSGRGRTLR